MAVGIDWSQAIVDSISVRALKRGLDWAEPGRPRQTGLEDHVLCDRRGTPLQVLISAADTPDAQLPFPLLDSFTPYTGGVAGTGTVRRSRTRIRPMTSRRSGPKPLTWTSRSSMSRAAVPP